MKLIQYIGFNNPKYGHCHKFTQDFGIPVFRDPFQLIIQLLHNKIQQAVPEGDGTFRRKQGCKEWFMLFKIVKPKDSAIHNPHVLLLFAKVSKIPNHFIHNPVQKIIFIQIMQIKGLPADIGFFCQILHGNGIESDVKQHSQKGWLDRFFWFNNSTVCHITVNSFFNTHILKNVYYYMDSWIWSLLIKEAWFIVIIHECNNTRKGQIQTNVKER